MRIFVLLFMVGIAAVGIFIYVLEIWAHPVGPADIRVELATFEQLQKKYGSAEQGKGIESMVFTKNPNDLNGTYKIDYYSDKHQGSLYFYYDARQNRISLTRIEETKN